jgi:hypothetical protein
MGVARLAVAFRPLFSLGTHGLMGAVPATDGEHPDREISGAICVICSDPCHLCFRYQGAMQRARSGLKTALAAGRRDQAESGRLAGPPQRGRPTLDIGGLTERV